MEEKPQGGTQLHTYPTFSPPTGKDLYPKRVSGRGTDAGRDFTLLPAGPHLVLQPTAGTLSALLLQSFALQSSHKGKGVVFFRVQKKSFGFWPGISV